MWCFHYTLKHASWLNMVEIEIGMLRDQCLDRRIGERDVLVSESRPGSGSATLPAHGPMAVHDRGGPHQAESHLPQSPAQTDFARITFHFTPKHASWINQIEIWFSILVRKLLRRGNFTSREHLQQRIESFIAYSMRRWPSRSAGR